MVKFAPALLAGNTMVVKPSPTMPLTTLLLGRLALDHLPGGVLNVIVDDNDLGAVLTAHPDVAKISFTGSTATGRKVMASAAEGLKRLTLELGGNDPALLLPDTDVHATAEAVFRSAFLDAGQVCIAIKHVYVHEAQYDAFCEAMKALAEAVTLGGGAEASLTMGPVNNRAQFDKVRDFIARTAGEETIIAGSLDGEEDGTGGFFIRPTIVRDIGDDAELVREEQFGPVLPILSHADVDDAVALANKGEYGLGASVWGRDVERATQVAELLRAGTVWVNTHSALDPRLPRRGAGQSGFGAELGEAGLHEFTQPHIVNVQVAA